MKAICHSNLSSARNGLFFFYLLHELKLITMKKLWNWRMAVIVIAIAETFGIVIMGLQAATISALCFAGITSACMLTIVIVTSIELFQNSRN
jgi:hypothetical protein